jgi:hypothetical protein
LPNGIGDRVSYDDMIISMELSGVNSIASQIVENFDSMKDGVSDDDLVVRYGVQLND